MGNSDMEKRRPLAVALYDSKNQTIATLLWNAKIWVF